MKTLTVTLTIPLSDEDDNDVSDWQIDFASEEILTGMGQYTMPTFESIVKGAYLNVGEWSASVKVNES